MKDFRGQDIVVDSIIVYPGRKSSSVWVTEARVVELKEYVRHGRIATGLVVQPTKSTGYSRPTGKFVMLTALENVVVVK